jgi:hypothetical protein
VVVGDGGLVGFVVVVDGGFRLFCTVTVVVVEGSLVVVVVVVVDAGFRLFRTATVVVVERV